MYNILGNLITLRSAYFGGCQCLRSDGKRNPRLPRFGGSVPPPIRLSPPDIVSVCYFPANVRIIILTELAASNLLLAVIAKGSILAPHSYHSLLHSAPRVSSLGI